MDNSAKGGEGRKRGKEEWRGCFSASLDINV